MATAPSAVRIAPWPAPVGRRAPPSRCIASLGELRRRGRELFEEAARVLVRRGLEQRDGARHVLRHADAARVEAGEREARAELTLGGRRLEVLEDPRVMRRELPGHALRVRDLERAL